MIQVYQTTDLRAQSDRHECGWMIICRCWTWAEQSISSGWDFTSQSSLVIGSTRGGYQDANLLHHWMQKLYLSLHLHRMEVNGIGIFATVNFSFVWLCHLCLLPLPPLRCNQVHWRPLQLLQVGNSRAAQEARWMGFHKDVTHLLGCINKIDVENSIYHWACLCVL